MIVIGIVGSPAGGKSTVAGYLQDLGAAWINADLIARQVLERADIQQQLLHHFGSKIADNDGRVDRAKLALEVFGDDASKRLALTYLESLIHPKTRQRIYEELLAAHRSGRKVAVLDVPLMFEVGWDRGCDEIWCVDATWQTRLQRANSRGWDADQLRAREANQMSIEEKKRRSTVVIMNDRSLDELFETIDRLWRSLLIRSPQTETHCFQPDT